MKKYFGDKKFYRMVLAVAIPIMIQQGFTNLVNMLDNLMVGRIGTEPMSGVSIVNQLIFVYNLTIFGSLAGAGIYVSQYYGKGDKEGIRNVFRMKLLISAVITLIGILVISLFHEPLINSFLHDGSVTGDLAATYDYAVEYMQIMLVGLVPFSICQLYTSTMRETQETVLPMKAGVAGVIINLIGNYLLIYGKLGFPAMGVKGAAIATVISRVIECLIVIVWTYAHKQKCAFMTGWIRNFHIPWPVARNIIIRGLPLVANEFLWSTSMTMLTSLYSRKGLAIVAALNISSSVSNLFNVCFIALGSAIAIIMGQILGAGKLDEAKDTARKLIVFSILSSAAIGLLLYLSAPVFPRFYNTTDEVRQLATGFLLVCAVLMPVHAYSNALYFTLRSGGKVFITMLFDSVFMWVVMVPAAYCTVHFTNWDVVTIYAVSQSFNIIKCILGMIMFRKGIWINNLVA